MIGDDYKIGLGEINLKKGTQLNLQKPCPFKPDILCKRSIFLESLRKSFANQSYLNKEGIWIRTSQGNMPVKGDCLDCIYSINYLEKKEVNKNGN
jgi:hypothetical protein